MRSKEVVHQEAYPGSVSGIWQGCYGLVTVDHAARFTEADHERSSLIEMEISIQRVDLQVLRPY